MEWPPRLNCLCDKNSWKLKVWDLEMLQNVDKSERTKNRSYLSVNQLQTWIMRPCRKWRCIKGNIFWRVGLRKVLGSSFGFWGHIRRFGRLRVCGRILCLLLGRWRWPRIDGQRWLFLICLTCFTFCWLTIKRSSQNNNKWNYNSKGFFSRSIAVESILLCV